MFKIGMFKIGDNVIFLYKGKNYAAEVVDIKEYDNTIEYVAKVPNGQRYSIKYYKDKDKWESFKWEV